MKIIKGINSVTEADTKYVSDVYQSVIRSLDSVMVGQGAAKIVVAASLLCSKNSKILLTGGPGMSKTTLAKFLANAFNYERISINHDVIPTDIQNQLKNKRDIELLLLDEFNRVNGKSQSTFTELFEERQMTIDGVKIPFGDFYVLATQNDTDIAGSIFNIPQNMYDRFDVNVYFEDLQREEKKDILFSGFIPETKWNISKYDLASVHKIVDTFTFSENDKDVVMRAIDLIDKMSMNDTKLFSSENIRAHKFVLKLIKLAALASGRNFIFPADIAGFLNYVYMHRINQNVARIGNKDVIKQFDNVRDQILAIQRKR